MTGTISPHSEMSEEGLGAWHLPSAQRPVSGVRAFQTHLAAAERRHQLILL